MTLEIIDRGAPSADRGLYSGGVPYQDGHMPLFARPVADERDGLLTFLAQQRDALRACVLGLSDDQARATPAASGLSLGGLIKHAARTERRWVAAGIAGQPLPGLWPIENWPDDFRMGQHETLAGLLGYYADTADLTGQIIAEVADLGQPQAADADRSVRWVLLHLIKETARHAGHADIIRETLDGQRAGPLTDAYDAGLGSSAQAGDAGDGGRLEDGAGGAPGAAGPRPAISSPEKMPPDR